MEQPLNTASADSRDSAGERSFCRVMLFVLDLLARGTRNPRRVHFDLYVTSRHFVFCIVVFLKSSESTSHSTRSTRVPFVPGPRWPPVIMKIPRLVILEGSIEHATN